MPNMWTGNGASTPGADELARVRANQARILANLAKAVEDATYESWEEYEEERARYLALRNGRREPAAHGTRARYQRGKCRCTECTRANTEWSKAYRERKGVTPRPKLVHGSATMYRRGCRCVVCKKMHFVRTGRKPTESTSIPHGTERGYTHRKCRCDECRKAHNAHQRRNKPTLTLADLPPSAHGKSYTYTRYGCRCDECRRARSEYARANRLARKARAVDKNTKAEEN